MTAVVLALAIAAPAPSLRLLLEPRALSQVVRPPAPPPKPYATGAPRRPMVPKRVEGLSSPARGFCAWLGAFAALGVAGATGAQLTAASSTAKRDAIIGEPYPLLWPYW